MPSTTPRASSCCSSSCRCRSGPSSLSRWPRMSSACSAAEQQWCVRRPPGRGGLRLRLLQAALALHGLLPSLRSWKSRGARPRLRVFHAGEDAGRRRPSPWPPRRRRKRPPTWTSSWRPSWTQVLAKVARQGQASLTEPERQILMRASEIYKKAVARKHRNPEDGACPCTNIAVKPVSTLSRRWSSTASKWSARSATATGWNAC